MLSYLQQKSDFLCLPQLESLVQLAKPKSQFFLEMNNLVKKWDYSIRSGDKT